MSQSQNVIDIARKAHEGVSDALAVADAISSNLPAMVELTENVFGIENVSQPTAKKFIGLLRKDSELAERLVTTTALSRRPNTSSKLPQIVEAAIIAIDKGADFEHVISAIDLSATYGVKFKDSMDRKKQGDAFILQDRILNLVGSYSNRQISYQVVRKLAVDLGITSFTSIDRLDSALETLDDWGNRFGQEAIVRRNKSVATFEELIEHARKKGNGNIVSGLARMQEDL